MIRKTGMWVGALVGLVGIAVAGCSGTTADVDTTQRDPAGAVAWAGELGLFRLAVGDCIPKSEFGLIGLMGDFTTTVTVPCTQPHVAEVVLVEHFSEEDIIPSDACWKATEVYTGQRNASSPYWAFALPTPLSWDATDDRALVCIVETAEEGPYGVTFVQTTGSVKAAG